MIKGNKRRQEQIGLDRLIKFEWLERTAYLVLAGNEVSAIKTVLQEELARAFRSNNTNVRGSLDKTITILLKTWANAPRDIKTLQIEGLDLLSSMERKEHVAIQWCMIMAVYPFWGAVAIQTGRLIMLQGAAASSQVQRRVREQFGERETVSRRVRYVLRSFIDWGVLKETNEKGVYGKGKQYLVEDPRLIAWMIEATLYSTANGSAVTKDLLNCPCIFPFRLAHISAEHVASLSPRLSVLRHDLDDDLLMLR